MESREHALAGADSRASTGRRWLIGLARLALGIALLAALVVWGQINLRALLELTPSAVMTCLAMLLVSLPIAVLRWLCFCRWSERRSASLTCCISSRSESLATCSC